jgi:ribonuclease BN (tRNA processing enzyme)
VGLEDMPAKKVFHHIDLKHGIELNGIKIRPLPLRHPGGSFSYRFDFPDGRSMVYATDGEYPSREMSDAKFQEFIEFFRHTDLLIFDAQYTFPEAEIAKADWGHSSANIGVEMAVEAEVRHLVLFHHEPSSDDLEIYHKLLAARKYRDLYCQNYLRKVIPKIELAIEEGVITLDD